MNEFKKCLFILDLSIKDGDSKLRLLQIHAIKCKNVGHLDVGEEVSKKIGNERI